MRLILVMLLCLLPAVVGAQGDAVTGKALYATCVACHGADGRGQQALGAPGLVNLDTVYLLRQLENFSSGRRGGAGAPASAVQMQAMAATLTDETAVADVVAHIDALPDAGTVQTVEGDPVAGKSQYDMICGACHGGRAEGNPALEAPRLAGVDDWYLLSQLEAYGKGVRGTHPDDRLGAQMRSMAAVIRSEQAAKNVVAYIRSLEP